MGITEFEGKVVLVTGAARGIGKEIALSFGKRGAKVALNDVSNHELLKTIHEFKKSRIKCDAFLSDISVPEGARSMVEDVIERMSTIDVLVNNAGIATPTDFLDLEEDEWDRVLAVNLEGTFFVTQAVLKHMIQKRINGRIVMIGSIAGKTGGVHTSIVYDASKAGVMVMARSLARRCSRYGITVNAVAPAFVNTAMLKDLKLVGRKNDLMRLNLIQRLATPQDVANAVIFLASKQSSFITGETLNVNGGRLMD